MGKEIALCLPTAGRRTQFFTPYSHNLGSGNVFGAALYVCINANLAFLAGLGTEFAGRASSAADGGVALAAAVAAVAAGEAVVSEAVEGEAACHS